MKNASRRSIEVNVDELDRVLDQARTAPLDDDDYQLLKTTLHAMADRLRPAQRSEKMSELFGEQKPSPSEPSQAQSAGQKPDKPAGHGRNGAEAFSAARQVRIAHQKLHHGDRCPECGRGHVYEQKEPKVLVRIVGQAPLAATVYSLERLRCNACGQIFTAQAPEGIGEQKYDATAAAVIAQMKYGSGMPFHRLERLEQNLGIPLPAATQWEIAKEAADVARPAHEELIRQAAQGEVLHNDDTSMQNRALREYAARRAWTITMQIREVGSGASQRQMREKLMEAARRREIDVVLVWRLDRWGRSVTDLLATLQELEHLGVGFVSLTEALDLTTPAGRAMAALLAVFAAFEREILGERVRAGLAHARHNGKRLGRPLTAGLYAGQVRKLYHSGLSKSEISRRLNIGRTSVRRILDRRIKA